MKRTKLSVRHQRIVDDLLDEFREQIAAIERRQKRLLAARQGRATIRRRWVKPHTRPKRRIEGYYRTIIVVKEEEK